MTAYSVFTGREEADAGSTLVTCHSDAGKAASNAANKRSNFF